MDGAAAPGATIERLHNCAVRLQMDDHDKPRFFAGRPPRMRWPQRMLIAAVGVGLAITAFFFFVFALVLGALIATAMGIRLWWLMRKLRAQAKSSEPLEGEYSVIQRAHTTKRLER